jgi:Rieske 2Fe-2S family protein
MARRTAAPLDLTAVERVLQHCEVATTLPGEAYASPDVFAWEVEHFFEGGWACVGREADLELTSPGDQAAIRLGRQTFALTMDDDHRIHAFHNVCRHRGHELLAEGERRHQRAIRCPYHAWVYGLAGDLRATPRFDLEVQKDTYPLIEVPLARWHGWLFLNASADAQPFDEWIGNAGIAVDPYRPERLVLGARHEYELRANWKIVVENYNECYHCSEIHPELCRVTPPESDQYYAERPTGIWVGGPMELREHATTMSLTGESLGVTLPGLPDELVRKVGYLTLFPNLLVSPHPDYLMTHRLIPLAPDRTWIECAWYFPPEAFDHPGFSPSYASDFWDVTNREDWAACESVQRNVTSDGHRPGPFSYWENEVFEAQTVVARGYLEGRMTPPDPKLIEGAEHGVAGS